MFLVPYKHAQTYSQEVGTLHWYNVNMASIKMAKVQKLEVYQINKTQCPLDKQNRSRKYKKSANLTGEEKLRARDTYRVWVCTCQYMGREYIFPDFKITTYIKKNKKTISPKTRDFWTSKAVRIQIYEEKVRLGAPKEWTSHADPSLTSWFWKQWNKVQEDCSADLGHFSSQLQDTGYLTPMTMILTCTRALNVFKKQKKIML